MGGHILNECFLNSKIIESHLYGHFFSFVNFVIVLIFTTRMCPVINWVVCKDLKEAIESENYLFLLLGKLCMCSDFIQ